MCLFTNTLLNAKLTTKTKQKQQQLKPTNNNKNNKNRNNNLFKVWSKFVSIVTFNERAINFEQFRVVKEENEWARNLIAVYCH